MVGFLSVNPIHNFLQFALDLQKQTFLVQISKFIKIAVMKFSHYFVTHINFLSFPPLCFGDVGNSLFLQLISNSVSKLLRRSIILSNGQLPLDSPLQPFSPT